MCHVCHELLDVPKSLPCLHTFCLKCLEQCEASRRHLRHEEKDDPPDRLMCPVCGSVSEVSGGARGLTTNFVFVKLIEHLKVHQKLTSGDPLECGKCLGAQANGEGGDAVPSIAMCFCYECQAPLCDFCRQMHRRTLDLSSHSICQLDEIRQADFLPTATATPTRIQSNARTDDVLYVCSKHREPLKWYCFTCEEVICGDCTITKKEHRDHSFEFIREIIAGERAELTKCLGPLGGMREMVTGHVDRMKAHGDDLRGRQEKRWEKIDAVFDKSAKRLEQRREVLKEASRKACESKCKNLDLQLDKVEMVKGAVDSAIDFTHTTVEEGSDVEVMLYKKEILARLKTLEEMLVDSAKSVEALEEDSLRFVHDETAIERLGELSEAPSVLTSVAGGEGLMYPVQDEETTFVVQARNARDQPLLHGGGACSAEITTTPAPIGQLQTVPSTVTDNRDGTYTVAYRPPYPGVNRVTIHFDNQEIQGSPFEVNVVRNYSRPIGMPHTFPLPNASPWGVAMISDTEMVVTASDCIVHVYNIEGEEIDQVTSNFTRPYGIATDHRGHLWITDREAHMVQKFQRDEGNGQFVKLFQFGSRGINAGQFSHPRGIAVNPDNDHIYISDMKNNRIQIFAPDPTVPTYRDQFGSPGKTPGLFNLPAGLCFNREGRLVVCDDHNCRLQVFDAEGRFVETLGTTQAQKGLLCSPIGIAMDFHGRYVITEFGSHCVTFLSPQGDILNCVRSVGKGYGQFVHPRGIALDSAGYVYIADNENMRIARF